VTIRPRKKRVPVRNGNLYPSRDRRQNPRFEDQQPATETGPGPDERRGERHGLLTFASQILTSTTTAVRAVVVTGAVAALATGAILATGITRIDVGPIHIIVRDAPAHR
jgi:hypothetical protein